MCWNLDVRRMYFGEASLKSGDRGEGPGAMEGVRRGHFVYRGIRLP